jgi:hypothetical protein
MRKYVARTSCFGAFVEPFASADAHGLPVRAEKELDSWDFGQLCESAFVSWVTCHLAYFPHFSHGCRVAGNAAGSLLVDKKSRCLVQIDLEKLGEFPRRAAASDEEQLAEGGRASWIFGVSQRPFVQAVSDDGIKGNDG